MNDSTRHHFPTTTHPGLTRVLAASAVLALIAVVVLFAWNSFAVTALELNAIRFKEALALTVLVAITGRLLVPRRRHNRSGRQLRS